MLSRNEIISLRKEISEKIISLPEGYQRICFELFRYALNFVLSGEDKNGRK